MKVVFFVIAVHLMLQVTELTSKPLWADCDKVHREGFSALAGFRFIFAEMLILKFYTSTHSTNVSLELRYFLKVYTQCLW